MTDSSIIKNHHMKIGLDLDDTIIDHSNNIVLLAQKYGIPDFSHENLETGRFASLKETLSPNFYKALREELYEVLSKDAPPMTGSERAIQELKENGIELYIISRRSHPRTNALLWIQERLPFISQENIYFVNLDEEKGALCHALKIDIFLDNKPEVLTHMPERTISILFDGLGIYKENPPFQRVSSWNEFYEMCGYLRNRIILATV